MAHLAFLCGNVAQQLLIRLTKTPLQVRLERQCKPIPNPHPPPSLQNKLSTKGSNQKKKREKSGQADRFGGGVTPLQPDRFYL